MQLACEQRVTADASNLPLSGSRQSHTESCFGRRVRTFRATSVAILIGAAAVLLSVDQAVASSRPGTDRVTLADLPRIRTLDRDVTEALRKGEQQSATLRRLVDALQRSDVVVYLERHNRFRDDEAGRLRLAGAAAGLRYLHVSLSTSLNERELIVFVAHELAHAVEIANASHVVDARGMTDLYCRIGWVGPFGYDTVAAQRVTEMVGDELEQSPDR